LPILGNRGLALRGRNQGGCYDRQEHFGCQARRRRHDQPTANLAAAAKLLTERHIGAVVILGADHRVIGVLSERDIVRALADHGPTALGEPVSQVMSRDVKTCSEDDTIGDLMGVFIDD
jgi:predicted transcriptional regulator